MLVLCWNNTLAYYACIMMAYLTRVYKDEQGRPEKLRGPEQRVKVGPLTQVVR